jgi:hypothetical protein
MEMFRMESFEGVYSAAELGRETVLANQSFLGRLERRLRGHRSYDHPLALALAAGDHEPDEARFVFAQMLEIIEPYTGLLSLLAERAPDLRSRHLVLEELCEQMGRGRLEQADAMLWRRLLRSMGVEPGAESCPPLASIARMNARLREQLPGLTFPIACTWVAFGEAPALNLLGYLARTADIAFAGTAVERTYFDRRAKRDTRLAGSAHLLIAVHATPDDHPSIERAAREALDLRAGVFDDIQTGLSLRRAVRALGAW